MSSGWGNVVSWQLCSIREKALKNYVLTAEQLDGGGGQGGGGPPFLGLWALSINSRHRSQAKGLSGSGSQVPGAVLRNLAPTRMLWTVSVTARPLMPGHLSPVGLGLL